MTSLDLVLEAGPAITNKVKVGAELTFITVSHISYFKCQQDLHRVTLHFRELGISGNKFREGN